MTSYTARGYSALQVSLHWVIAALVLFQLIFGESMTTVRDAAEGGEAVSSSDQFLATAHYWVGIAVLVLVALRLMVRLASGPADPVPGTAPWMAIAAKITHWLFYGLLVAVPVTGLLTIYGPDAFGDIHSLGKPIFIALIALHALAALFHQFWVKDGTLKRMLVPSR